VVTVVVGYLAYKAGQLYYHSQEMAAAQESYKANTELLQLVIRNPNGRAESQVDLNNLAHNIQSDEARLAITGSQVASDAVSLTSGAASAGRAAASGGPSPSSGGVDAEKAMGAGVKVGTKAVKEFVKATQEKPGQQNQQQQQQQQQQQRQQPPPPPPPCPTTSGKKC
jgi:hypothetical protein